MKIYISEYALTHGILEFDAEPSSDEPDMVLAKGKNTMFRFSSSEFHTTRDAAIAAANDLRRKKIEFHKMQIAKLEKLEFK